MEEEKKDETEMKEEDVAEQESAGSETAAETVQDEKPPENDYEARLARYAEDYEIMAAEIARLKQENSRYMMRETIMAGREMIQEQKANIEADEQIRDYDDLWKEREG